MDEVHRLKMRNAQKSRVVEAVQTRGRILGVQGSMDSVQSVIPLCYAAVRDVVVPGAAPDRALSDYHVVVVGCPGKLTSEWCKALVGYVSGGGWLVTTDWAVAHILERWFPSMVYHAGTISAGNVPVLYPAPDHPLIAGAPEHGVVRWDIERSSYLIGVKNEGVVEVLIVSPELKADRQRKGLLPIGSAGKQAPQGGPVMVTFRWGKGRVVHFISHLHLQASDAKGRLVSAYILTNVLDEAVCQAEGLPQITLVDAPPLDASAIRFVDGDPDAVRIRFTDE